MLALMSKSCSLLPGFLLCLLHCLQQVLWEPSDRVGDSIPQSLEQSIAQGKDRDNYAPFAGINGQTKLRCHPKSVLGHQPSPTLTCTKHQGDAICHLWGVSRAGSADERHERKT